MQSVPKYVFYGGAFGAALVALALASVGTTSAGGVIFLSQSETNAAASTEVRIYQQLSCEDITYDITHVDLALSKGEFANAQDMSVVFGRLSGAGGWEKQKKREVGRSNVVSFSEDDLTMVTFGFPTPVRSDTLCQNADDMVYFSIDRADTTAPHPLVHGSSDATSYRSALYNCVLESGSPCLGDVADIGFSLATAPNEAPVIQEVAPLEVYELETLSFTLLANDPDGDTIRWGSSNLPDGAVLVAETGEFSWTPTAEQVKDYKITFVATDDGGPIEESSSITVFVSVLDADTVPDDNQTLLETVLSYELDKAVENSYVANLKSTDSFVEKGQTKAAGNQVRAFLGKLEQDNKRELITEEQYIELVNQAEDLLARIESEE